MCRLFAIQGSEPESPMAAMRAMDAMREGHDGSGVGLYLTDLGGVFEELRGLPILSGIFTRQGLKRLDEYMMSLGFTTRHRLGIKPSKRPPPGIPRRDHYVVRAYDYPDDWKELSEAETRDRLMRIRLALREMGQDSGDMIVFSFWPDTVMLKEIGDPMSVAEHLGLEDLGLSSRVVMAQGRQNTNYAINLYACHPFFLQGVASMTNGENTAFVPIKEFLESRGFPGYSGYQSDSEVFTHILHYTLNYLGLGLEGYKHIITPLQNEEFDRHPDGELLRRLKRSCRRLIIDGPNCTIGCLPDNTLFMAQDRKKLRPGVVGGRPGRYVFSSEFCGLEAALPEKENEYFQPMHLDTALVGPDAQEVRTCSQMDSLHQAH